MNRLSRRTVMGGLAAASLGAVTPRRVGAEIVDFVVVGKDGWLFAVYDENKHFDLPRMKGVIQGITDAVAILRKGGIEVAITLSPAKSRIYADMLPADYQMIPDVQKRYAMAVEMLSKPGILVPDLATVMLNLRKAHPDVDYFLKADTHWTGDGAEPCAVEMANQIKAKIKLPASSKPGTTLGAVALVKQPNNDLAEGLPDARASKFGPQSYHLHQVGGGLLDDDSGADVLLVGNSYMQPKYGFAPMLSNQLGRPVTLAWKVHQSSPYKTLLEALGKAGKQKPKLLVWDFEETDMMAPSDRQDVWGANALTTDAFLTQLRSAVGG